MKIEFKALFAMFIFVFTPEMARAQDVNKNINKPVNIETADKAAIEIGDTRITISEAIIKAIENNKDILTVKYDAAMTDTYYQKYLAKYSPYLSASGGTSSAEYPEVMQSDYGKSNKSTGVSASLAKNFSTGSTIAGGVSYTYSKIKWDYPGIPENYYNPVAFVSLEQELLKNAFGYSDRKQEKILKNATGMQKNEILYGISLVATGVIVDYWNVIITKALLDNSQLMLRETDRVRRIVAENAKIGLAEEFEMNYWKFLIAASEAAVVRSEQQSAEALRRFMQTINIDKKITLQEKAILQNTLPEINSGEALQKAYAKRADYLNALKTLENAKLQLDINSNEALPSLTARVIISNNQPGFISDKNLDRNPYYEAQIRMTYPIDNTDQKVNERNSKWKVEQAKHQVEKYKRIVKDDIASKIEKIYTNYKLYQKAGEEREQAEIYYKNILANMRRGRFTAAVVRNSLDALVNSKCQELQVLIAFNASLLEFELAKNELFDTYGIDVNKYISADK